MAFECDVTGWVDQPDYSTSLSVEDDAITEILVPLVDSTQDDYVVGVELREDWVDPRREFWDLDQNPGNCPEPEHLHGIKSNIVTLPAGNVALLS